MNWYVRGRSSSDQLDAASVNNVERPVPLLGLTVNEPPMGGPFTVTSNEDELTPQLKLNVTEVRVGNAFAKMDRLKE
jgi:hypothetical protein